MEGTGILVPGVVGAAFAGCGSRSEPADSLHHRECRQRGGGTDEDEAAADADGNVPDLYGPRRRGNLGVVRLHLCRPRRVVRGRRLPGLNGDHLSAPTPRVKSRSMRLCKACS